MARTVNEWIGKTDDAMPPPSVFRRLYRKQKKRCPECTRELVPGNITRDHTKAIIFGGANREKNLRLICTVPCSKEKSGEETSRKAKADRTLNSHLGLKAPSKRKQRPFPGSRRDKIRKKVNGEVVLR